MTRNRLLIAVALVCEILAAAGFADAGVGSIHVNLVAAGLAFYFLAAVL